MNKRIAGAAIFVVAVLVAIPINAAAHALLISSDPEEGAHLTTAPAKISLTFAEAPSEQGSVYKVKDGCKDEVVSGETISGETVNVELSKGQPGIWSVNYKTVSAVDGHVVSGDFLLSVAGNKDCSGGGGGGNAAPPTRPTDEGGGFPWLLFGGGTLLLVVVAFGVRRSTSK